MAAIVFANETLVRSVASFLSVEDGAAFSAISRICYVPGQQRLLEELTVRLPRTDRSPVGKFIAKCTGFAVTPRLASYVRAVHFHKGTGRRSAVGYARYVAAEKCHVLSSLFAMTVSFSDSS